MTRKDGASDASGAALAMQLFMAELLAGLQQNGALSTSETAAMFERCLTALETSGNAPPVCAARRFLEGVMSLDAIIRRSRSRIERPATAQSLPPARPPAPEPFSGHPLWGWRSWIGAKPASRT